MSTHEKLRAQLDRAVDAHRRAHRDRLAGAGLEDYTEATVSPLGPAGDLQSPPGENDG